MLNCGSPDLCFLKDQQISTHALWNCSSFHALNLLTFCFSFASALLQLCFSLDLWNPCNRVPKLRISPALQSNGRGFQDSVPLSSVFVLGLASKRCSTCWDLRNLYQQVVVKQLSTLNHHTYLCHQVLFSTVHLVRNEDC